MAKSSLKEIAAKVGVHVSTVSLALRDSPKIPPHTRDNIQKVAKSLGYVPNYLARGLVGASTNTIGILVPKLRDSFVIDCVGAQERWMQEKGYTPLLLVTHCKKDEELKAIDNIIGRGADGIIFNYMPSNSEVLEKIQGLANNGFNVGILGSALGLTKVDYVDQKFEPCGYEITRHLLELGHRKISILVMSMTDDRQHTRLEGYRRALAEFGVPYDPLMVFDIDYVRQNIANVRKEIMSFKERPTAICAYNDDLAAELIMDLINAGFNVPEDVSVTGVNDGWYSSKLKIPLTTYRLPTEDIGRKLVELLITRIEKEDMEPQHIVYEGELVVRESSAKILEKA